MAMRIWVLCAAIMAFPAHALEYRMPVEEPQNFVLEEALATVIEGVAEQMTGMARSEMTAYAPDLFSLSEALVNSYGFDQGTFLVDVDVDGLKTRLAAANIPLWTGPRPEFLLWATEERGLERVMVGLEANPVVDGVLVASERFALPIRRPLMDLEDTLALAPAEIWGGFSGVVERASARYGAEHIVVLGDRPDRQSLRFWVYEPGQDVVIGEVTGETADIRVASFMRKLLEHARSLQVQPVVPTVVRGPIARERAPTTNTFDVGVSGTLNVIVSYQDPVQLMALLDHLEADAARARVSALRLTEGVASIQLTTDLSLEATDQLISSFGSVRFVSPLSYALN